MFESEVAASPRSARRRRRRPHRRSPCFEQRTRCSGRASPPCSCDHSNFAPLSFTTFVHLARSAVMKSRNSAAPLPTGSEPSARMRSLHVGLREDLHQLVVQPRDDRRRQVGRPEHAVPADEFVAGQRLRHRRHVRHRARRAAAWSPRAPRSLPARTCGCRGLHAGEVEVVAPAEQVDERRAAALVGNVLRLDAAPSACRARRRDGRRCRGPPSRSSASRTCCLRPLDELLQRSSAATRDSPPAAARRA